MKKYISTIIASIIGVTLSFSPIYAAATNTFKVVSWQYKDAYGAKVNSIYANGRYYVKKPQIKIQYYGYYTISSAMGSIIDKSCHLKVNGTDINVNAISAEYENYEGNTAVKIVCDFSDLFSLNKGKNTIQPGGAFVVQGTGVIPFPAKYDTIYLYYDVDGPVTSVQVVDKPSRYECTISELNRKANDCKVKIAYTVKDEHGYVQTATLKYTVPGAASKSYTIPSPQFDGGTYYLTVDLKDMGITRPGTYYFNTNIEATDEAGNNNGSIASDEIRVNADPTATSTSTPTATPTQEVSETPTVTAEQTESPTTITTSQTPTKGAKEESSQKEATKINWIAIAASVIALVTGTAAGFYINRKRGNKPSNMESTKATKEAKVE